MQKKSVVLMITLVLAFAASSAMAQGVMFVKSGRVGIGVANPSQILHVQSAGSTRLVLEDTSGAPGNGIMMNLKNAGPAKSFYENTSTGNQWNLGMLGTSYVINNVGKTPLLTVLANGNVTTPGNFVNGSSRAIKQDFEPVDVHEILAKVVELPISEWAYISSSDSRHLGPVAEDFWASFGLGMDDKHIGSADTSGVALAAIQGLNHKLQQRDAEIQRLEERLESLERLLSSR